MSKKKPFQMAMRLVRTVTTVDIFGRQWTVDMNEAGVDGLVGVIYVFKNKTKARAWYGRKVECRSIEPVEGKTDAHRP